MIQFDAQAQELLNVYLKRVRDYLRGFQSVDSAEVEHDVQEHIERELQETPEPISLNDLDAVLKRLGSPIQWIPEEGLSWWRKMVIRLWSGPEDWRLAYISFALVIIGFLFPPAFIVMIPASFCISRAAVSLVGDPDELKSQKWLIYPSLVIVYLFFCFWLFLGPTFCCLADGLENSRTINILLGGRRGDSIVLMSTVTLTALWWFLMGCAYKLWPRLFHLVFRPFAETIRPMWVNWFMGISAALSMISLSVVVFTVHF